MEKVLKDVKSNESNEEVYEYDEDVLSMTKCIDSAPSRNLAPLNFSG